MTTRPRIPALKPRIPMAQTSRITQVAGRIGATQRKTGRYITDARRRIWLRDGPHCAGCGRVVSLDYSTGMSFELDHITPLWAGGADEDSNKQCLCVWTDAQGAKRGCHIEKTAAEAAQRRRQG